MKRLSVVLAALGLATLTISGAAGLMGDSPLFGTPPEAVAEGFVEQLVTGRYDRASEYLSSSLGRRTTPEDLKNLAFFIIMRSGDVIEIRGTRGPVDGSNARATAHMKTSLAGEWSLGLRMVKSQGTWAIDAIGTAKQTRMQESIFGIAVPGLIVSRTDSQSAGDG